MKRFFLTLAILAGLALVAALAVGYYLRREVLGSLPQLDGRREVPGLAAAVTVERDSLGVPTVRAGSRIDAARATGFLHGQDRFFQMDLLRRRGAGELAELFGPNLLRYDRAARFHRFRTRLQERLKQLPPDHQALLQAYAEGTNAGLNSLAAPPPEYLLSGVEPAPWKAEDSLLVLAVMAMDLQDDGGAFEATVGALREMAKPAVAEFLAPRGTRFDAPIDGSVIVPPRIPQPGEYAATDPAESPAPDVSEEEARFPGAAGSNAFAVGGGLVRGGGALLANDIHLRLSVPNLWYRVSLVWPKPSGGDRCVTGITLPGLPFVVAGSNGAIAWGLTNAYADASDVVLLTLPTGRADAYLTPEGEKPFEKHTETLRVRDQPDETMTLLETIWGPVMTPDYRQRPRALRWAAHQADAFDLRLSELEETETAAAALDVAAQAGGPALNVVVADASGAVGWTVAGRLPNRVGFDGSVPVDWTAGLVRWEGWLEPARRPRALHLSEGRIWSANQRMVGGESLALLGDSGYDLGARASQIRDRLLALKEAAPGDLHAVQLDDEARYLARWRTRLLAVLTPEVVENQAARAELRRLAEAWDGRATPESIGYRLVRRYRRLVSDRVLAPLYQPYMAAMPGFRYSKLRFDEPLESLLEQRPPHLRNPDFPTWDALLLDAADTLLAEQTKDGQPLASKTWGALNTGHIRHPLSQAVPYLARWFDMPAEPFAGDSEHLPRIQSPDFGATERFVVAPGREAEGIFTMPGGQSGHPFSPYYRAGHDAWVRGQALPFLPGPAAHTLLLDPLR